MSKKEVQFYYISIEDALLRAEKQKVLYENNLVGKSFIYSYVDNNNDVAFREILFGKENYLHLTGLDYQSVQYNKRVLGLSLPTDSLNFYNRLGNDATLINDVSFIIGSTPDETTRLFKYTQQKLNNLSQLTSIAGKAEYIGKYKGNRDFDIIINRNSSAIAFIRDNSTYIPVSSLYGKAEEVATDIKPVLAIFSKENDIYKLQYLNAKINIGKKLFSPELLHKIQIESFDNSDVKFNLSALAALKQSFTASVKRNTKEKLEILSSKRECTFNNETALADYENEMNKFIGSIQSTFEAQIAIDVLTEQNKTNPNDLIKDEISEIRKNFGLSVPTLSDVAASQPLEMHAHEEKPIFVKPVMQNNGMMVLAPAVPPNDLFTQLVNTLVKGLDNVVHKVSTTMDKLNFAATKALNSLFTQKPSRTPSRASQSKSKDNSSKKVKNVKKERPVAPVKHSAQKQEHRSSVLAELKTIKAEQQAQDKPERSHQHRKTKSNDREI